MKLRPFRITFVLACLVTTTCLAQRHPSRTAASTESPPLPSSVRLAQAVEEDLDGVLDTARDLLDQLDPSDSSGSDLNASPRLPESDNPAAPKLPRTLDEYRQDRTQRALDNLDRLSEDDLGLDDVADGAAIDPRYQDVQPNPYALRRRRPPTNMPFSLGAILGNDDEINPCCEAEFCRRMWACAGGRCQDQLELLKRGCRRDRLIRRSCDNPGCLKGPFSVPFICPKCQQARYTNQGPGGAYGAGYPESLYQGEPGQGVVTPVMESEIGNDYGPSNGYRVLDDRPVSPIPDPSMGRRTNSTRRR